MDINSLTIGQARELAAMFSAVVAPTSAQSHTFVGKYCICRCTSAGVHAGVVVAVDGDRVILNDSRRLWQWQARAGVALSGVAQNGLAGGKLDTANPEIYLTGVCEVIPCSAKTREDIENAK